ncbi:hypothetical protein [Mesorhizobium sp.]|uniref:hypothetical protein n=1 Tax=Mesorhizobium sp. TaxID=1871066 RepID=UPI003BAADAC5
MNSGRLNPGPLLLACMVLAYTAWFSIVAIPTNVDVSWLLSVCDRLLEGEQINTDMFEVNPPFSIWLYMPFMLLERFTGIGAEFWLTLGVACLGVASLILAGRIMAGVDAVYRRSSALWMAAAALFLILCFLPDQFGQREHFALIALLPWLALQCARQRTPVFVAGSRVERILAGLGAGIVVMVKPPYFALALILPSLFLALHRRSLKPLFVLENLLGALITVAYIASIAIFDRSYFSETLPLVRDVYLPMHAPLLDNLANWPKIVLLLAVTIVLVAGGPRAMHWDTRILLASALGFVPAFLIMGKGWPNHALPMLVVAMFAFGVEVLRFGKVHDASIVRKAALVFGSVLVMQMTIRAQYTALTTDNGPITRSVAAIRDVVENPTIVSIAGQMQVAYPLTRLVGGRYISRYPGAWAVVNAQMLVRGASDTERRRRLEDIRDGIIGEQALEIKTEKPDIVLSGLENNPSWNALMLKDERVAASLKDYRVLYREPLITVYVRNDVVPVSSLAGTQVARPKLRESLATPHGGGSQNGNAA